MLPDFASIETTRQEVPFSVAVVRKTRSFQTTGDDQPSPGMAVFQTIFDWACQCCGRFFSVDVPCRVGPRKPGQFSPRLTRAAHASVTAIADFMGTQLLGRPTNHQKKLSFCPRNCHATARATGCLIEPGGGC